MKFLIGVILLFVIGPIQAQTALVLKGKGNLEAVPLFNSNFSVKNLMGVGIDPKGTIYVSQSFRDNEELSILRSFYLQEFDMSLTSVEQKKEWILNNYSSKIIRSQRMRDLNKDGKVDFRDLSVRKERVLTLSDPDRDGYFDKINIFAEGFNDSVAGRAHSVMPIGDHVYTTVIPDLWEMTDSDQDGKADQVKSLVHGFASHFGYGNHDLHSIIQGYDGKLYWSMGDRGLNVKSREGHRVKNLHSGAILRCNPDGSEFEVFATGLRNCQYFDFDDYGNLFSIDHDADFQDERERLVYLPEGSDSGWRCYYQYRSSTRILRSISNQKYNPWLAEKMWMPMHQGQGRHFLPAIENSWNAPASFSYQPGTALGGKYKNHFLLGCKGFIVAFKMKPDGASFKRENEEKLIQGLGSQILSSDFAPNGELVFVLWKPGNKSTLWALRNPEANQDTLKVQKTLNIGVEALPKEELISLLNSPDRRLRRTSQFELVERKETSLLKSFVLDKKQTVLARVHALWALNQLKFKNADFYSTLVHDSEDELKAQTARVLGNLKYDPNGLIKILLNDPSLRVQSLAAIAVAKLKTSGIFLRLIEIIEKDKSQHPVLRYNAIRALAETSSDAELLTLKTHKSSTVRNAAVNALRIKKAYNEITEFLSDTAVEVKDDAARALYDTLNEKSFGDNRPSMQRFAQLLSNNNSLTFNVRSLAINRRLGDKEAYSRILNFVIDSKTDKKSRNYAFSNLLNWSKEHTLDPVDGRYFPIKKNNQATVSKDQVQLSFKAMQRLPLEDQSKLLNLLVQFSPQKTWAFIESKISDKKVKQEQKIVLLNFLAASKNKRARELAEHFLNSTAPELRTAAAKVLSKRDYDLSAYIQNSLKSSQDSNELKLAVSLIPKLKNRHEVIKSLLQKFNSNEVSNTIKLEIFEVAEALGKTDQEIQSLLKEIQSSNSTEMLLSGGNPEIGKRIFLTNTKALCSKCHSLSKSSMQIGPSLEGISNRHDSRYFLQSMLDPQAVVTPGYGRVSIVLKDQKRLEGILMEESKTEIHLKGSDGKVYKINKKDVQSRTKAIGGMISMKGLLSKRELRDLVAFLNVLK